MLMLVRRWGLGMVVVVVVFVFDGWIERAAGGGNAAGNFQLSEQINHY
jgi:hypothetical protein